MSEPKTSDPWNGASLSKILDTSSPVVGRCAACRFWKTPDGGQVEAEWNECARPLEPNAPIRFEGDGGYVSTRSDFGCVQFERKDR